MTMDELKLKTWRERFERAAQDIETEHNAFFSRQKVGEVYCIIMDESDEWRLQLDEDLPNEIKSRLLQAFLTSKPEDSV